MSTKVYTAKVIIVEDNPQQLELYKNILAFAGGINAETFATGTAGMERVRAEPPPDIIMLDMHLPGVPGVEIFRHVRDELPEAAIFVVTGDMDLAQAYQGRADKVFLKPNVPIAELLESIALVAGRRGLVRFS